MDVEENHKLIKNEKEKRKSNFTQKFLSEKKNSCQKLKMLIAITNIYLFPHQFIGITSVTILITRGFHNREKH